MIVTVTRLLATPKSTRGILVVDDFECFTLEDAAQPYKIPGRTRIPQGMYRVTLRTEGGMHPKYAARLGAEHRGMLWLRDVPGFEYVYIHIGNTPADTEGCILVGNTAGKDSVGHSEDAYREVNRRVVAALERGEEVLVDVRDDDR